MWNAAQNLPAIQVQVGYEAYNQTYIGLLSHSNGVKGKPPFYFAGLVGYNFRSSCDEKSRLQLVVGPAMYIKSEKQDVGISPVVMATLNIKEWLGIRLAYLDGLQVGVVFSGRLQ
jgi:hypothetical protein